MIKTPQQQATHNSHQVADQRRFVQLEQQFATARNTTEPLLAHSKSDLQRWLDEYLDLGLDLAGQVQKSDIKASWLNRIYRTLLTLQTQLGQQRFSGKYRGLCSNCIDQVVFALHHLNGRQPLRQRSLLAYHENAVSCRQI